MGTKEKTYLLAMVALLTVAALGTTFALTVTPLDTEYISAWTGEIADSGFSVESVNTYLKGQNKVTVITTVKNNNNGAATANVTVQLLDSNGNIITIGGSEMDQTQSTGSLNQGGTKELTFTFTGTDLVSQYDSTFIVIKKTA